MYGRRFVTYYVITTLQNLKHLKYIHWYNSVNGLCQLAKLKSLVYFESPCGDSCPSCRTWDFDVFPEHLIQWLSIIQWQVDCAWYSPQHIHNNRQLNEWIRMKEEEKTDVDMERTTLTGKC